MDAVWMGGLLVLGFVLFLGVLLTLQVWLAGKSSALYGLIQPALWLALPAVYNLYTANKGPDPMMEATPYGMGALVLAVLSLLVFAGVRLAAKRRK